MMKLLNLVKSLEVLSLKRVSETIQHEAKEQKGGFHSILLGTLGVSLSSKILAGKRMNRAGEGIFNTTSSFNYF